MNVCWRCSCRKGAPRKRGFCLNSSFGWSLHCFKVVRYDVTDTLFWSYTFHWPLLVFSFQFPVTFRPDVCQKSPFWAWLIRLSMRISQVPTHLSGWQVESYLLRKPLAVVCREKGRNATLTEMLAVFIDHSADRPLGGTALPPPLLWSGDYWRVQWCWWLKNVHNSTLHWGFPLMSMCCCTTTSI